MPQFYIYNFTKLNIYLIVLACHAKSYSLQCSKAKVGQKDFCAFLSDFGPECNHLNLKWSKINQLHFRYKSFALRIKLWIEICSVKGSIGLRRAFLLVNSCKTFFLILPSSFSRYSSAPKTKRIFQMLRCIFEGCTNRAQPSQPFLKNCQYGIL